MASASSELQSLLQAGIAALQRGERERGRALLLQVIERDEHHEQAWLWLSQAMDDPADAEVALENVLTLNPANAEARARLDQLRARPAVSAPAAPPAADPWQGLLAGAPPEPDDGLDDPLQCVYCGRPTQAADRKCPHCGQALTMPVQPSHDSAFLRLGLLLLVINVGAGIVELAFPLLTVNAASTGAPTLGSLQLVQTFPGVTYLFSHFADFSAPVAGALATGLGLRVAGLGLLLLTLSQRWGWAYYLALGALVLDVLANIYLLFSGLLGPVAAVLNLGLGLALLYLIGASYQEFTVTWERLLTQPDPRAHSAAAFHKLGHDYSRAGMWALAVAQWRRAVGLAPKEAAYYKHLGLGYARIQRYARSLRTLEEAARRAPRDPDLPEIIALVRQQAERSQSGKP